MSIPATPESHTSIGLTPDYVQAVVDALVPHVGDVGQRTALLTLAFGTSSPIHDLIVREGAPRIFAANLVDALCRYGNTGNPLQPALAILLCHIATTQVGVDKADHLRALADDVTTCLASLPNRATQARLRAITKIEGAMNAVKVNPSGTALVRLRELLPSPSTKAYTERLILSNHNDSISSASFSPDGWRIVTGSWGDTARVWDVVTGKTLIKLIGHTFNVPSASFSPDGQRIVTASWGKTARVWDAETGKLLATLTGHTSYVFSASYSPDGRRIVTACDDQTVRVWQADSLAEDDVAGWLDWAEERLQAE